MNLLFSAYLNYFLDSTISFIPVLSSPSTSTSANAGMQTKSTPAGATNPLAIATAFTAWFNAPAPIACISALLDSLTKPAIAPATEFGFDFDEILKEIQADIKIVDFHAEATAEKIAMGYYLDGRVTCVFGTHTHVQTADEKVLENGTAYITDIGMTGPKKSVIGMTAETSIKRFVTTLPEKYKVADGEAMLNGCIFDVEENRYIKSIKRINY